MAAVAMSRSVSKVLRFARAQVRPGFHIWRLQSQDVPSLDPYLHVDWFEAAQPTFPPHPHAGFSAVTVMLEESKGSLVNRDSFGDRIILAPGDTLWTCVGSGLMHEELPEQLGVPVLGLQLFVNLAPKDKETAPKVLKLHAGDVPVFKTPNGGKVRVIAGEVGGVSSPLNDQLLNKVTLLDVTLPKGASFTYPLPNTHNAFSYVLEGGPVAFGPLTGGEAATDVDGGSFCHFAAGTGTAIDASGTSEAAARFVLFAGQPIGAPVVWRGPFCGNSVEQVEKFAADYQAGRMGSLAPSPVWGK